MACSSACGSRFRVSGSTSTSTGRAPTCSITCTPEQNVMAVVSTASPGPIPSASSDKCRAAVQELTAKAAGASTNSMKSRSKRWTLGPVVIQSERSVSTTSAISSSPISGGEKGTNRSPAKVMVLILQVFSSSFYVLTFFVLRSSFLTFSFQLSVLGTQLSVPSSTVPSCQFSVLSSFLSAWELRYH